MDVDLVVGHREVAVDEVAVIFREKPSRLEIVAGECAHVVERVEQDDRLEFRPVALGAAEDK